MINLNKYGWNDKLNQLKEKINIEAHRGSEDA